jgi:hypothetical protein
MKPDDAEGDDPSAIAAVARVARAAVESRRWISREAGLAASN